MGYGVALSGLLGITHMPHFGCGEEVNAFVKNMLVYFHRGYIWLDIKVPFMIKLISQIIRFPMVGVNPLQYFRGKDNDKSLVVKLKN